MFNYRQGVIFGLKPVVGFCAKFFISTRKPQSIIQSVVRLFFDLLHGLERDDVPLVTVVEFTILLGYDGQLDQDSDMEKELFESAIYQLKERFSY